MITWTLSSPVILSFMASRVFGSASEHGVLSRKVADVSLNNAWREEVSFPACVFAINNSSVVGVRYSLRVGIRSIVERHCKSLSPKRYDETACIVCRKLH